MYIYTKSTRNLATQNLYNWWRREQEDILETIYIKDEASETIVRNLFSPFPCIQGPL